MSLSSVASLLQVGRACSFILFLWWRKRWRWWWWWSRWWRWWWWWRWRRCRWWWWWRRWWWWWWWRWWRDSLENVDRLAFFGSKTDPLRNGERLSSFLSSRCCGVFPSGTSFAFVSSCPVSCEVCQNSSCWQVVPMSLSSLLLLSSSLLLLLLLLL